MCSSKDTSLIGHLDLDLCNMHTVLVKIKVLHRLFINDRGVVLSLDLLLEDELL